MLCKIEFQRWKSCRNTLQLRAETDAFFILDLRINLTTILLMAHTALNDEEIKEYFDTAGKPMRFSLLSTFLHILNAFIQTNLIKKSKLWQILSAKQNISLSIRALVRRLPTFFRCAFYYQYNYHRYIDIRGHQRFSRSHRCLDSTRQRYCSITSDHSQSRADTDSYGVRRADEKGLSQMFSFSELWRSSP